MTFLQQIVAGAPSSPGVAALRAKSELIESLAGAVLQTYYQPIVRMADRAPVALEVLARMEHPKSGTIQPGQFVPQIETAGWSRLLTKAVVTCAFKDYIQQLAPLGLAIALNFPLDVLMHRPSLDWLEARRQDAGVPVSRITIELTESLPVAMLTRTEQHRLHSALHHVRALGYGLAIDDVSPEMPDYNALFEMNFTAMKLDKPAVIAAGHDRHAEAFLIATIEAAKAADLRIVAEGIEDSATWERMQALGVDEAQGFLVARPLAADAVTAWRESWR